MFLFLHPRTHSGKSGIPKLSSKQHIEVRGIAAMVFAKKKTVGGVGDVGVYADRVEVVRQV